MSEEDIALLSLSLVPGLGTQRILRLRRVFGSASNVFSARRRELKGEGLSGDIQCYILAGWARKDADDALERAGKEGIGILTLADPLYPEKLAQIYDPPPVLYFRGRAELLSRPSVSIVGSRKASLYGAQVSSMLARQLASVGVSIVSGLARGVDTRALWGAVAGGGTTVAVLGTGVDVVYPRENRKLYEKIRERGCVISEFPIGTFPAPQNFPVRNRIISGLSLGTLIPEAAEFSGSLITARLTLEQDRELMAVPGQITNPGSYGPNHLIKQGATPVLCYQDVLETLPAEILRRLKRDLSAAEVQKGMGLSLPERKVVECLDAEETRHFDWLLEATRIPVSRLSSLLMSLESQGLIRSYPGRRYALRL